MKRIVSALLSLLLAAALLPFAAAAEEPSSVTYTGSAVNACGLEVGDSFYWTFGISKDSRLWGGHWLIDYPEQYLTPTAASTTWNGGLYSAVMDAWDEGVPTSDKPEISYNLEYEGMTSSHPMGEAGNMYSVVLLYLMSFEHGGLMAGGDLIRFTYAINSLPCAEEACHDECGYYIELPILVEDSVYWPEGMTAYDAGSLAPQHEQIDIVKGKVYLTPADAKTAVYTGGTAEAAALAVGDTFTVDYNVDLSTNYLGGLVCIDYPEEYLTPVAHDCPWDGFAGAVIPVELEFDNDGNAMTRVEVSYPYIVSDTSVEMPEGEVFISITYRIDALPDYDSLPADDLGAYLELPILAQNSTYTTDYNGGVELWYYDELTFPAKVYMPKPHTFYTVSFLGFNGELLAEALVEEGMPAVAPDAPYEVESEGLSYLFIRWAEPFDEITEDTAVHAIYLARGDVDGSGNLSFQDIAALYQYVSGAGEIEEDYIPLGDVNADGSTTFADVAALYALIIG